MSAIEQERLRIAHDLHDDLGSELMAVKMAIAQVLRRLPGNDAGLHAAASQADQLVDRAIDAMHRVLHDLRPPELDLGLVAALRQIASDFQTHSLPCEFSSNQPEIDAPPESTLAVLRICREALTNISKHAGAGRVELRLTQQHEPDRLLLEIIDDGRGYPADQPGGASLLRRVEALGGTLERPAGSSAAPSAAGCHLRITIPSALPPKQIE
jgi:signal transduction histidine kinase